MTNLADFGGYLAGKGLAERTGREYVKLARRWITWCRDYGLDPTTADTQHVRSWADSTLGKSWASRKQARSAMRHWFTMHQRVDEPWDAVRVPRKPKPKYRGLSPEDAAALRDAALLVGGRRGLAVLVGLYTGARSVEIAGLRWDGVAPDTIRWWRSKTSEYHEVPLHPVLRAALDKQRPAVVEGWVFAGDRGRAHVNPTTIWEWVTGVAELAGVGHVSPHQLRSTAGTTVLEATGDLDAAAEFLGHSDPAVTRQHYTRTSERRLQAAVASLDW